MSFADFAHRIRSRNLRKVIGPAHPFVGSPEDAWNDLTPADLFARVTA